MTAADEIELARLFEDYKNNPDSSLAQTAIDDYFRPTILRFITNKTHDHHLAEDLTQETFIKFFQEKRDSLNKMQERFSGLGGVGQVLKSVLYWKARQCIAEYYRKKGHKPGHYIPLSGDVGEPIAKAADEDFLLKGLVMNVLEQMPVALSRVLQLVYLQEKSRPEVAASLGVTIDHVRYMETKAVKRALPIAKRYGWSLPMATLFTLARTDWASAQVSPLFKWVLIRQFAIVEQALLTGKVSKVAISIMAATMLFNSAIVIVPATLIVGLSIFSTIRGCESAPQQMKPPDDAATPAVSPLSPTLNTHVENTAPPIADTALPIKRTVPAAQLPVTIRLRDEGILFGMAVTVRSSSSSQFLQVGREVILDCVPNSGKPVTFPLNMVWTFPDKDVRTGGNMQWTPDKAGTVCLLLRMGTPDGNDSDAVITLSVAPSDEDIQPVALAPSMLAIDSEDALIEPLRIGDSQIVFAGCGVPNSEPAWTGLEEGNIRLIGSSCVVVKPRSPGWQQVGFEIPQIATPVQALVYFHDASGPGKLEILAPQGGTTFPLDCLVTFRAPSMGPSNCKYAWSFFCEALKVEPYYVEPRYHNGPSGNTVMCKFDRLGEWVVEARMSRWDDHPPVFGGKGPIFATQISIVGAE